MSTAITVHGLDRDKLDLIKQTVAKGATDLELQLFFHACERTGLDPLMKQIYAIKRWSAVDGREVMTFQTGIDGLRLIADRTKQYAGSDEPVFQLGEDGFPDVASVTVYKLVGSLKCAFTHSVRWKEYVQLKKDGTPTAFWTRMPFGQLGKCAESGALRKAFPMELSGLYSHEEMMQADSEPKSLTKTFAEKFPEQAQKIQAKLAEPAPQEDQGGEFVKQFVEKAPQPRESVPPGATAAPAKGEFFPVPRAGTEPPPFTLSNAVADHEAVIADIVDAPDGQRVWDEIVADKTITSQERAGLYKLYQARLKSLPKAKK